MDLEQRIRDLENRIKQLEQKQVFENHYHYHYNYPQYQYYPYYSPVYSYSTPVYPYINPQPYWKPSWAGAGSVIGGTIGTGNLVESTLTGITGNTQVGIKSA